MLQTITQPKIKYCLELLPYDDKDLIDLNKFIDKNFLPKLHLYKKTSIESFITPPFPLGYGFPDIKYK